MEQPRAAQTGGRLRIPWRLPRIRIGTFAKILLPLLAIVGLTVGHSGYSIYRRSDEVHRAEVRARLGMVADLLAESLSVEEIDALRRPTDFREPAYGRVMRVLRRSAAQTDIAWVGLLRQTEGQMSMVADLGETGIGYPFFYATPGHYAALRDGVPQEVRYTDEFGSYVGQVAPVRDPEGRPVALVEVSVHRDLLELFAQHEAAQVLRSLGLAVALAMLMSLVLTVLVVERPLRRLGRGVAALGQGNFDHKIEVRGEDEFAQLAGAFNHMAADLKTMYDGLEGLVQARTRSLEDRNSELKDTLEKLRSAQEQLLQSEKLAAIGQLVSGVAHELNNPLAGVMGYAQLCLSHAQDPRLRQHLEKICKESERAARIVRNLGSCTRRSPHEDTYLDVNEVLRTTLELREYDLRVSNVKVEVEMHPGPLRTLADFNQLQQVFLNVINNADQAIRSARGRGRILCRTEKAGSRIRVTIADDGPGISGEILGRIFDPFFTTKEVGEGTGLGLSICFGIVQQHGGTIRASNLPEGGAEFVIELPVKLGESVQEGRPAADTAVDTKDRRGRILVVDDETSVREVLRDHLSGRGHRVDVAASSRRALELLQDGGYGLIISDLKMPDMGGADLYEEVRRLDDALAERMIFSTGDTVNPEAKAFLDRVDNPRLHKPYRLEELDRVVGRLLPDEPGAPVDGEGVH